MVLVRSGLGSEPGGDQRWRRRGRCRRWPVRILRAGSRGVPKARTPREFKQNRSSRIRSTRWSVQAVYYPLYYLVSPFLSLSLKHAPSNLLLSTLSLSLDSSLEKFFFETAQTREIARDGTKSRKEEEEEGRWRREARVRVSNGMRVTQRARYLSVYLSICTWRGGGGGGRKKVERRERR